MSIQTVRESKDNSTEPAEDCCMCGKPSRMWNPDNDVAICTGCAETANQEDLPSKKEWFKAWRERNSAMFPGQLRRNILT